MLREVYEDNIFYVCTMIEYVSRVTTNERKDVVKCLTIEDIKREIEFADINHCLSFEQVADEWIDKYKIPTGNFDNVGDCMYNVPSETAIGRLYQILVLDLAEDDNEAQMIIDIFSSFISEAISDFNASYYYRNPDYLKCSYEDGYLLEW